MTKSAERILRLYKDGGDAYELVHKYYSTRNPDDEATIFDEVYAIVNDRSRILYFLNTLLSSTKVPAYVIAAYIKKLSRLSLKAKPKTLVILLRLVGNLFLRHPVLLFLRDRVDDKARELESKTNSNQCTLRIWIDNDPFDPNQVKDLKRTNAMDSCIWELMPLRFHKHPKVAEAAAFLSKPSVPDIEFDLDELVIRKKSKPIVKKRKLTQHGEGC